MNNEIKEILEDLQMFIQEKYLLEDVLNEKKAKSLLDYITNLQTIEQQYSALLSENAELENKITNLQQENKELLEKFSNKIEEVSNLIKENEKLKLAKDTKCASEILCECLHNQYKSRCEKVRKIISSIFNNEDWYLNYDYNDLEDALKNIFKTINGGDKDAKN